MTFTVPVELVVVAITGTFGFFSLVLHGMWMIVAKLGELRVDMARFEGRHGGTAEGSFDV